MTIVSMGSSTYSLIQMSKVISWSVFLICVIWKSVSNLWLLQIPLLTQQSWYQLPSLFDNYRCGWMLFGKDLWPQLHQPSWHICLCLQQRIHTLWLHTLWRWVGCPSVGSLSLGARPPLRLIFLYWGKECIPGQWQQEKNLLKRNKLIFTPLAHRVWKGAQRNWALSAVGVFSEVTCAHIWRMGIFQEKDLLSRRR